MRETTGLVGAALAACRSALERLRDDRRWLGNLRTRLDHEFELQLSYHRAGITRREAMPPLAAPCGAEAHTGRNDS